MQRLEVSGAVRSIYVSLGVKRLIKIFLTSKGIKRLLGVINLETRKNTAIAYIIALVRDILKYLIIKEYFQLITPQNLRWVPPSL